MRFINTDGLSFLGPGSEWFWTAVSAVALVVTLVAIYRQLRLQQGLKEHQQMEGINREWESERYLRSRLVMALTLREGGNLTHLSATYRVSDFWDNLGSLTRAGHVGRKQIESQWADTILIYWTMLEPGIRQLRIEHGSEELVNFEWLAMEMMKVSGDHSWALTPLSDERIDAWIAQLNEAIALEEALRP